MVAHTWPVMRDRLCLFCRYFYLDMGWVGTDVTPGDDAEILCTMHHWRMRNHHTATDMRRLFRRAHACADYEYLPIDEIL